MIKKEATDRNEDSETDTEVSSAVVPDGGWGWVIVAASLTFNIIYDGSSYSFGILYTNLLDYFGDSNSKTAWIGSLFFSVPLICGPVAAIISKKLGYRFSTMLGGFIVFLGFAISSFGNSIAILIFFYGLLSGVGASIPYFNSTVMIAKYFEKRRALATGIAECGAGLGTVIFAPLVQLLISEYGWRGALLILSGIVANIIVCGALYRPLKQKLLKKNSETLLQQNCTGDQIIQDPERPKQVPREHESSLGDSEIDNRSAKFNDENLTEESLLKTTEPEASSEGIETNFENTDKSRFWICIKLRKYFSSLFDMLSVFFIAFLFLSFTMYFWYDVPYVFLVDKTVGEGTPVTEASYLLSIIGIVHTFGIILYGFLGDRECINCSILFGFSILLCGASIFFVPFTNSYPMLVVLSVGFGLFSASTEVLVPLIVIEVVGLKDFEKAFGLVLFLEGIANLIGPPVAGKAF